LMGRFACGAGRPPPPGPAARGRTTVGGRSPNFPQCRSIKFYQKNKCAEIGRGAGWMQSTSVPTGSRAGSCQWFQQLSAERERGLCRYFRIAVQCACRETFSAGTYAGAAPTVPWRSDGRGGQPLCPRPRSLRAALDHFGWSKKTVDPAFAVRFLRFPPRFAGAVTAGGPPLGCGYCPKVAGPHAAAVGLCEIVANQ